MRHDTLMNAGYVLGENYVHPAVYYPINCDHKEHSQRPSSCINEGDGYDILGGTPCKYKATSGIQHLLSAIVLEKIPSLFALSKPLEGTCALLERLGASLRLSHLQMLNTTLQRVVSPFLPKKHTSFRKKPGI
ncbi:hypothetical protein CEXT_643001 [Caerostris extrusa]|uniref:Uncharacterized protein n=1 Tax=Caerostris extrusa TaxID=172846 RepID=A0AAV4X1W3_CAEEX|nr:hypothetical protein CEXT_643001 [Caerostris extrusa]